MKFMRLAALVCGVILMSSSLCLAEVDGGKISLGGVYPGMSEQDLFNAFGKPTYRDGDDWTYQNFKVEVEHGRVEKISTGSESIITPDGVRVGLPATALNSTFGSADKIDNEYDGVEYEYYSTDGTKKIEFKVVNGIIAKITCKIRD